MASPGEVAVGDIEFFPGSCGATLEPEEDPTLDVLLEQAEETLHQSTDLLARWCTAADELKRQYSYALDLNTRFELAELVRLSEEII
jgi:hypothetical protein